jgi:hypothetical protein
LAGRETINKQASTQPSHRQIQYTPASSFILYQISYIESKMPETKAEKIQDLVMASLFSVIAVVALVKCRRVIVLEGAEVRS